MLIKILASSKKEKERFLEQLTKLLLDELGYFDFRPRVHESGTDLELRAKHKVTLTPLYCRVKATPRAVGVEQLRRIFARYQMERMKTKKLTGLFLSFSGFHQTAKEWYNHLGAEARGSFHLLGEDKAHALARRLKLVGSLDAIDAAVHARIQADLGPRYLAILDGRFYWVQLVYRRTKATGFFVLDAFGEPTSAHLAKEIKKLDSTLLGKWLIDLAAREKVLLSLTDTSQKDVEVLAKETKEPLTTLRDVMPTLFQERLLVVQAGAPPRWRHDKYSLRQDFQVFLILARQLLEGSHRFRFLNSRFATQALSSGLIPYLERRFHLKPSDQERTGLPHLLAISPSALAFSLFGPNEAYLQTWRELETKPLPNAERERWRAFYQARLYGEFLLRFLTDAQHPHFGELLTNKGIKVSLLRASAKAANPHVLFFSLHSEPSPIEALKHGPHLPPPDPEVAMEHGMSLLHMQEYPYALELIEMALKELRDPAKLAVAWNGKGVCLLSQRRYAEAIHCFNESLRYDNNVPSAWLHKAICLKGLGDTQGALRCCQRALEIDPTYKEAKAFLETF
ncbi:MAG: tetratricopeptide repeat protein [candidate division NC10 bacterium]|nr:tetratricopeptide repeat protein [candidate division NC10 bacterium]